VYIKTKVGTSIAPGRKGGSGIQVETDTRHKIGEAFREDLVPKSLEVKIDEMKKRSVHRTMKTSRSYRAEMDLRALERRVYREGGTNRTRPPKDACQLGHGEFFDLKCAGVKS